MSKLKVGDKVQFRRGTARDGETWTVDIGCNQRHTVSISTVDMKDGVVTKLDPATSVEHNAHVTWSCGCLAVHRDYYLETTAKETTGELRKSRYGRCESIKCSGSRMTTVLLVGTNYYCKLHAEKPQVTG